LINVPIAQLSNQSFSARLENARYNFTIKEARGIMVMDIIRNNVPIISGQRIVAGRGIIPYQYLENGNFVILTENDEIPYYTNFNDSQFLYYFTTMELSELRAE